MRRDDPKRLKLRAERERAEAWLDVLCKGFGHSLADGYGWRTDELRPLIELIQAQMIPAIEDVEAAEKAYAPYWRRRRTVMHRRKKAKTKAADGLKQ